MGEKDPAKSSIGKRCAGPEKEERGLWGIWREAVRLWFMEKWRRKIENKLSNLELKNVEYKNI